MARTISVGGITTAKPGVYQNSVQRSQGSTPSRIDPGIVAILAESTGTIAPTVPTIYRKGASANAIAQLGGDLRDAVMAAFSPSKEDPSIVRGAREVYAIRVNTATQSASALAQSTPTNVLTLTSRGYGLQENGISRTMAAGTNGAFGSKLTISRYGYTDEVGDDLGFLPAFAIRYYGAGTACSMSVDNTALTTSVSAGPGGENLNLAFATYDTIAKLSEAVNGFRNGAGNQVYEMVIMAKNPTTFACTDLDKSSSVAILTENDGGVGVGLSTTALTDFDSGSITGLDAADLIRVTKTGQNDEWLYTTSVGSPNVLKRGYNNTTAQVWAAATAVTFRGVTATWKAVQDWVNTYSQHATATRASYTAEGLPAVSAKTYFTGGGEGSATSTQWQAALDELRNYRVNHIIPLTSDSSFHTLFDTHMTWRWGDGGLEGLGYVAAAANETLAQVKTRAKQLNSMNISLHFQGLTRPNYQGTSTAFAPWMMAVTEAAMRAGMAFGEGTEYKRIFATAISYNTAIDLNDDGNTLSESGISYADYWDGAYRFVRCLSTWTNNDDAEKIQFDVRNSLAFILYKTRFRIRERHLGRGQRKGSASSVKSTLKTAMEELRDIDEAILDGSRRIGDDIVPVPAFVIFPVETNGNVTGYGYQCTPAGADLFFTGDTFVEDYSDVA